MMKQIPFHGPFRKKFQKILPRDYASKSHFHVAPAKNSIWVQHPNIISHVINDLLTFRKRWAWCVANNCQRTETIISVENPFTKFFKNLLPTFFYKFVKKLLTRCKYCNYVLWSKIPAKFRFSKFVRQLEFDKNSVVNFWVKIYYVTVRECLSKTSGKISWIFSGYVFELPWRHETRKNISWNNSELSGSNPESRKLFSEPNDVFVEIFVIRKNQKIKPFVL